MPFLPMNVSVGNDETYQAVGRLNAAKRSQKRTTATPARLYKGGPVSKLLGQKKVQAV